jgi:hypothetical protein
VVGIDSLLQSFKGSNVVSEAVSKVPYLKEMVRRKMDRLLSGRGKQDVSPHSDRYHNTNGNDLRHDCRYVTPVRSKRSTLPTECYKSLSRQRSATLGVGVSSKFRSVAREGGGAGVRSSGISAGVGSGGGWAIGSGVSSGVSLGIGLGAGSVQVLESVWSSVWVSVRA